MEGEDEDNHLVQDTCDLRPVVILPDLQSLLAELFADLHFAEVKLKRHKNKIMFWRGTDLKTVSQRALPVRCLETRVSVNCE